MDELLGAKMNNLENLNQEASSTEELQAWIKPEILSFKPVEAAEGISYRPSDGISNLTP